MALNATEITDQYPWINTDFFFKFKDKFDISGKNLMIQTIKVESALGKGENFCSNLIRLNVDYTLNSEPKIIRQTFILKASIPNKEFEYFANEFKFFTKEIAIYVEIMPQVKNLLKTIGYTGNFSPRCYGANKAPDYLLFEDLNLAGYRNVSKAVGLDKPHLKLVLSHLAKWHASTAVLNTTHPDLFRNHRQPLIGPEAPSIEIFLRNILRAISKACQNWAGYKKLSAKLRALEPIVFQKACDAHATSEFTVLNHGDLWINNIMYRYKSNGDPSSVMLIDYALGALGSPGKDLTFLLFSSSDKNAREQEWESLIQIYHRELTNTLEKLNFTKRIPSISEIYKDCLNCGIYNVLIVMQIIGLRHLRSVQGDGMLGFMGLTEADEQYRINLLSNPSAREEMCFLLEFFNRNGYFDL